MKYIYSHVFSKNIILSLQGLCHIIIFLKKYPSDRKAWNCISMTDCTSYGIATSDLQNVFQISVLCTNVFWQSRKERVTQICCLCRSLRKRNRQCANYEPANGTQLSCHIALTKGLLNFVPAFVHYDFNVQCCSLTLQSEKWRAI